jgi:hypothetical protein
MILDTEGHEIGYIEGTGEPAVEFDDCGDGVNSMRPREYTGYIGEQAVGTFRHEFNPFVFKTNADFSLDANRLLDKRMGIAAAVLLCAVEGRQQGKAKDFDPS